jgi:hypothetical protein
MKKATLITTILLLTHSLFAQTVTQVLDTYNVTWNSQSKNSGESMPVGGGDSGLNVWVEGGDLLFYLSRSGTFDENNEFLKLGRVRIRLQPNIFQEANHQFRQELDLKTGAILISGKTGRDSVSIQLWVDVFNPEIHLEIKGTQSTTATAFYENWRTQDRYKPIEERHSCFSYSGYLGEVVTYRDSTRFRENQVIWYHRNRSDKLLFDFSVAQQGLTSVKDQLVNPQKNLTFGGLMQGTDMESAGTGQGTYDRTPYTWWAIKSKRLSKTHQILIRTHIEQAQTLAEWENHLLDFSPTQNLTPQKQKNLDWWREFWDRSHIFINTAKNDTSDLGWQVGRNYQLFRYMLACNAYGKYPTKFNGGLFTTAPAFVPVEANLLNATPDFRKWGGGSFTAQNQRLVYWPMLKSGDFDMMPSQFDFYKRSLKNVELRSQVYWGHGGASFTEHPETFGLPFAGGWGFDKGPRTRDPATPFGEQSNPYVKHHFSSQIDFAFMILKYHQYSGRAIQDYLPFVKSALNFFFEHYEYRHQKVTGKPYDENGKLVIYPSTAAETYKNISNPTDISSGLMASINSLLNLPDELLDSKEKAMWYGRLARIPELSYGTKNGKKILVPAYDLPKAFNAEIPELYPVFPYEQYGIGKADTDLQVAIDTWNLGTFSKNHISWHQDGIFCARMGLTEEAKRIAILKLKNSGRRFPAFWGPGHDYVPDHNWGGSGMIGLQDMAMQAVDGQVFVLPAWPKEWAVDFKLHAPGGQVIYFSSEK